ncbi:hypothetical protein WJX84_005474 [Apatococcus fuscideae]|uniref:DUF4460 domain-containing protein n=1 Tax=Apatococcus fuscideae TaxID=2026836 RepID=A0AAW1SUQ8_9CHLO
MDSAQKQLLRAVLRQVHPDLFVGFPVEREQNSEALKVLNNYLDQLSASTCSASSYVTFWVKVPHNTGCQKVDAQLPAFGSLGPLFFAFGLISQEDLRNGSGRLAGGGDDKRSFVGWLGEAVAQALEAAEQHTGRQQAIRALSSSIKERFQLSDIQLGGEFAVTSSEQVRQLEALARLQAGLEAVTAEDASRFSSMVIRLYHPDSSPFDPFGTAAELESSSSFDTGQIQSHLADDGVFHVVAEPDEVAQTLAALDLSRARILRSLATFWGFRVQELSPALSQLLGVEDVFCDSRSQEAAQQFVMWAGQVLQHRDQLGLRSAEAAHAFSLLIHTDQSAAMIDLVSSSSLVQVRSDCPVPQLLDFLASESSNSASRAAQAEFESKEAEARLLEQVREALGASQVVRLCPSWDSHKVVEAAHRLLQHAPSIRASVDLSGARLAIDDCYELWESGFISIPHHFRIQDLQPQLQRFLSGSTPSCPDPTSIQPPTNGHSTEAQSDEDHCYMNDAVNSTGTNGHHDCAHAIDVQARSGKSHDGSAPPLDRLHQHMIPAGLTPQQCGPINRCP